VIVGALALAVFAQAVPSLARKSLTFDELTYIPSGYTYVATGDYRLNPEHPPLAKLLGGLALLPLRPAVDTTDASWGSTDQWAFGRHFFDQAGADTARLVTVARLPIVALTALLVVFAWLFARELYGRRAGLLAAWLCAFSPNLLAHGRLVTTDLAHAAFVLITSWAFYRLARAPSPRSTVLAGCALGLALLTKYSAVLLPGLAVVWVGAAAWFGVRRVADPDGMEQRGADAERASDDPVRWPRLAVALAGSFVLAAFVVTLAYQAPGRIDIYVRNLGVLYTNVHTELPAWLGGRFHEGRVWYYFVAAFLLKTPTAFLALLTLRAADQVARRDADRDGTLHLLLPAAVWFVLMSATGLPFGVRYVLPAYPLLFVWASGILASPAAGARVGMVPARTVRAVVAGLAILFAAGSLRAWPHYIPYFNLIAGGPDNGIEWLDDSNVDWGQDLPLLRDWLVERGIDDAVLVPMGLYDPALYGVPGRWATPQEVLPLLTRPNPPPGVYAVGAHLLTRARWGGRPEVDPLTDLEPAVVLGHSIHVFVIGAR
jgi:hypothetical protein